MSFCPSTDDEPRPVGRYLKMRENGIWTLRVLTPFLAYDMAFLANKPVRREPGYEGWRAGVDYDAEDKFGPQSPRRAWACAAWVDNFKPDIGNGRYGLAQRVCAVQVAEFAQASIRQWFSKTTSKADWSDPRTYDVTIARSIGKNGKVQYDLDKELPKPLIEDAVREWDVLTSFDGFDINRLLTGGDPFKP